MTSVQDASLAIHDPYDDSLVRADTLHPLLGERWSPRAFDPRPIDDVHVASLLEAARWAPSGGNAQPWRFLVGRLTTDGPDSSHAALVASMAGGNQVWARHAPLLVAGIVRAEDDGLRRTVGPYELGLAIGQLSVQAQALGLAVHHIGGFEAERVATDFDVPGDYRAVILLAVGRIGDPADLPDWARAREGAPRTRLQLAEIAFAGEFGTAVALDDGFAA